MNRLPIYLATLVVLLSPSSSFAQLGLNQGPMIWLKERTIDFGKMKQAAHSSHVFPFENRGTEPLVILNIETSCGCTAAAPTDSLIAPGGSAGIHVTFSSRDFVGEHTKAVVVHTNDPAEPRIDLTLKADVIPFIRQDRDWVDFGRIEIGQLSSAGALISADLGTDFNIPFVKGGEEFVTWKIIPASVPDEIGYRLEATLRPDAPLGSFTERIEIKVDHPNRQSHRIGLKGTVFSHFILEDKLLKFKTVRVGKTVRRSTSIEAAGPGSFEITDVVLHSEYLKPELKETATGYDFSVTLISDRLPFEGNRHPFTDYARLITNDPRQPEIMVELRGVLLQRK